MGLSTCTIEAAEGCAVHNICCIGAGYVGGPTCAVIAQQCPDINVHIVDLSEDRIRQWNNGPPLPIHEPGLDECILQTRNRNLFFSTNVHQAIQEADLVFISVNTPTKSTGRGAGQGSDLSFVESAARAIVEACNSITANDDSRSVIKIIVEKSTVPCGTNDALRSIFKSNLDPKCPVQLEILSNPEFLAEGTAMKDLIAPDRILIGSLETDSGRWARDQLAAVYSRWIPKERIVLSNIWSSEMSKLAANAMLAQRISSINALSALCEQTGADIGHVSEAIGRDGRIGSRFLQASLGFGGSCFRKDILSLIYMCRSLNLEVCAKYWQAVLDMNDHQTNRFSNSIISALNNTVLGKRVAVFGFAFKKNTGDTRESPAIAVVRSLLEEGANVAIYDPVVTEDVMRRDLHQDSVRSKRGLLQVCGSPMAAVKEAYAVAICTEWDEFSTIDYNNIYQLMNKPAFIFDGRRVVNVKALQAIGFQVRSIGASHSS